MFLYPLLPHHHYLALRNSTRQVLIVTAVFVLPYMPQQTLPVSTAPKSITASFTTRGGVPNPSNFFVNTSLSISISSIETIGPSQNQLYCARYNSSGTPPSLSSSSLLSYPPLRYRTLHITSSNNSLFLFLCRHLIGTFNCSIFSINFDQILLIPMYPNMRESYLV